MFGYLVSNLWNCLGRIGDVSWLEEVYHWDKLGDFKSLTPFPVCPAFACGLKYEL